MKVIKLTCILIAIAISFAGSSAKVGDSPFSNKSPYSGTPTKSGNTGFFNDRGKKPQSGDFKNTQLPSSTNSLPSKSKSPTFRAADESDPDGGSGSGSGDGGFVGGVPLAGETLPLVLSGLLYSAYFFFKKKKDD
ncbi:MAG: hypothetical protein LBD45_07435 [Bacteroidales bacterium]|jgi:hypothetical protein|nr:hypothetical protein [Bacteroidales bacterium]